ncbi:MAG TPA: DUF3667 domain-containing protein [Flavisolibacter sp.]
MSHQPERKEKNCLNCGTNVAGRYCQTCGQENIVPKQTVWGLITHFVYDIFHFDGKFFHTVQHLLFKPGFIPREYIAGKRMSYLDPIRMYLFTSAVFFLVFFSISKTGDGFVNMSGDTRLMTKVERLEYSSRLHQQVNAGARDTLLNKQLNFLLDTSYRILLSEPDSADKPNNDSSFLIQLHNEQYLMDASLPTQGKGDTASTWFNKKIREKWTGYKKRFADDEKAILNDMVDSFIHKFPYILFVSLPFFALILKLLYIRRKPFFYSDHAVFTLYHYIFTFILLLVYFLILKLNDWLEWGLLTFLATILFLSGGVYLFIAMKRFYGQGWLKTLGKFLLLNILALLIILILMIAFVLLSVFQL